MPTFLDASGLSTLLQKIKTVFATKTELNALENDLVSRANTLGTTFVHKTGNETIEGTKTFSATISGTADKALKDGSGNTITSTYLPLTGGTITGAFNNKVTNYERGVTTTKIDRSLIDVRDANGTRFALLECNIAADKSVKTALFAYNTTAASGSNIGSISIGCDTSGAVVTSAPTPAVADDSTKIATTAWTRTATGNFACNAASATKLATARNINGVSFNGTANITVADSTKLPLSGGALTGSLRCTAKYTSADTTYTSDLLTFNSGNNSYGNNVALGGGGNTIIGGGESYSAQLSALAGNGSEACYVCADNAIYLKSNCNTFANAKTTTIGTDGKVACPQGFVGTISSSSDMRLKKDVESISSKMLDAWDGIEWVQFKFKADDSKMHFGIIAQDLNRQLSNSGIEASSCTISESNPNYDPATMDELPEALTVNYIEALVIEAAYQRRRADRLEERLSALERKVESLKS